MHGSLPGLAAGRFGVIMFFSACRLPSFAPEDPPSHASKNQITTGSSHTSTDTHHYSTHSPVCSDQRLCLWLRECETVCRLTAWQLADK